MPEAQILPGRVWDQGEWRVLVLAVREEDVLVVKQRYRHWVFPANQVPLSLWDLFGLALRL